MPRTGPEPSSDVKIVILRGFRACRFSSPRGAQNREKSAPERLRRRLGALFSAKIVILRRFWLGRACLQYRFRMRFLKQFSKNTVFYESEWPSWADFLVFYDEFWRPETPENAPRSGQNPRKTSILLIILYVRAVRSEARF